MSTEKSDSFSAQDEGTHPTESPCEETKKQRLVIRYIKLENFKSYGGHVCIGPLHRQFNATVGPNGSGKSNVIDAILFVFGKRAKQMRSNRVSELIHRSEAYPDAASATVTIEFVQIIDKEYASENEPDEVVPGSGFTVTRTAARNNTSAYLLNDESITYTELQQFLRSKGIDLDNNRFLILQGEVEQISLMKPKAVNPHDTGLLEYLEDIIGSNKLVAPIEEAIQELETLTEERTVRLNRLKAVDKEREALEEAKFEAEQYLVLEHDIYEKRLQLHELDAKKLEEAKAADEAQYNLAKKQLETERDEFSAAEKAVQHLVERRDQTKQAHTEVAKAFEAAKEAFAELERRDVRVREDFKHLAEREKKAATNIRNEERRHAELEQAQRASRARLGELQQEQPKLETELANAEAALQRVYDSLRTETTDLRSDMERKQTELLPLREKADAAHQRLSVAQQRLQLLVAKQAAPEQDRVDTEKLIQTLEKELSELGSRIASEIEPTADAKTRALRDAQVRLENARKAEEEARQQLSRLRRQNEEANASHAASSGRNRMLEALWKASQRGSIRGFIGRLGDLGTVPDAFVAALEAAAGSALDHLVVENVDDAQACIEMLRENKMGRATFIILEKIRYLQSQIEQSKFPAPEGVPRLFDLLDISNAAGRLPFYFVLRNTLVARDLEQATRIAFQPTRRNRVVTLSGQLIETSGTMCGGGGGGSSSSSAASGRGTSRSNVKQSRTCGGNAIQAAPPSAEALAKAEECAAKALETLTACERERDSLLEQARSANQELERARLEKSCLEQRLQDAKNRMKSLNTRSSQAVLEVDEARELVELQASIPHLERECAEHDAAASALEALIREQQERILAIGGERLVQSRDAVKKLQDALQAIADEIRKLEIALESNEKTLEKSSEAIRRAHLERQKLEEQRQQRDAELCELEQQAATVLQAQHDDVLVFFDFDRTYIGPPFREYQYMLPPFHPKQASSTEETNQSACASYRSRRPRKAVVAISVDDGRA